MPPLNVEEIGQYIRWDFSDEMKGPLLAVRAKGDVDAGKTKHPFPDGFGGRLRECRNIAVGEEAVMADALEGDGGLQPATP